jgi:hypothetical protein
LGTDRVAPYYVKALAMGIPAYLIGVHLWSWILMSSFYLGGHSDFRQIYAAAYMVRTGHSAQLYDPVAQGRMQDQLAGVDQVIPFVRPAYELIPFVPLTFLRYRTAYFVLLAANVTALALIYGLLRPRFVNLSAVFSWLPAALFLAFLPIAAALIEGQDSILLLLMFTVAFLLAEDRRELLCGVVVGLALFKFQVTIPLALIFLLWRRWEFLKGFALSGFGAGLLSLWITGATHVRSFLALIRFMAQPSPIKGVYPLTIERMTNLHGLIFGLFGRWLSPFGIVLLTVLASATLLYYLARLNLTPSERFLVALTGSLLLSYYLFFHDISSLFLPLIIALDRFEPAEGTPDTACKVAFRLAALLFAFPVLMSFAPGYLHLATPPMLLLLPILAGKSIRLGRCLTSPMLAKVEKTDVVTM